MMMADHPALFINQFIYGNRTERLLVLPIHLSLKVFWIAECGIIFTCKE